VKTKVALLFVLILALIIKFWRFADFATYNAETAQHYLEIIKLTQGQLLLEGPLTSHPWLRLSSTPYYLFYPFFVASYFHPLTLPFLWTITSCLMTLLSFYVVKRIFDNTTALISSFLYLVSPNILLLDRNSGFFPFIVPLMYLLLLKTHQLMQGKHTKVWLLFFLIGVMCTLHAAALFLVPFYIGFLIVEKMLTKKNTLESVVAFFIPQLPFLLIDSTHSFTSSSQLILWIPYKILNFLTGKTLGVDKASVDDNTLIFISNFYKQIVLPTYLPWWVGILLFSLFLGAFIYLLKKKIYRTETVLLALLLFGTLCLVIHKNPPAHYFVPIIVLPLILIGRFFSLIWKQEKKRWAIGGIFIFLSFLLFHFIFSSHYLFAPKPLLSYPEQLDISNVILANAQGKKFKLIRVGPFDTYTSGFKENYEYLLWWQGNRPQESSQTDYIIVEDLTRIPIGKNVTQLFSENGIAVIKIEE
jgi:hypothetical protein